MDHNLIYDVITALVITLAIKFHRGVVSKMAEDMTDAYDKAVKAEMNIKTTITNDDIRDMLK